MIILSNIFNAFLGSIIFGVFVSAYYFFISKSKIKSSLNLRNCAKGFGFCAISNISLLIITMGYISGYYYFIIFIPFMYFSFMLNKKLIIETRLRNHAISFIYKAIATLLIWFIAFFPFSLLGVMEIINMPEKKARNHEIFLLREEISNYETFADLTPFGLGVYKLRHEGDNRLWDVTQLPRTVIAYDGVDLVFVNHFNRRGEETWDNEWNNSNVGIDVMYEIFFYEGTYIIITPLRDSAHVMRGWGLIYLCKELDADVDLFMIAIPNLEVVEKLRELPGEQVPRRELAERLGKNF